MAEIISAEEGFVLTNGKIYGSAILLGEGASREDFYPIPISEYEAITACGGEEEEMPAHSAADVASQNS